MQSLLIQGERMIVMQGCMCTAISKSQLETNVVAIELCTSRNRFSVKYPGQHKCDKECASRINPCSRNTGQNKFPFRHILTRVDNFMKPIPTSLVPRLFSTLTLWTLIVTTVVFQSENGYCLLIAAAALGSLWEYFWLLKVDSIPRHWRLGYCAGIILLCGNFYLLRNPRFGSPFSENGGGIFIFEAMLLALLVLILFSKTLLSFKLKREMADAIAFTLLGIIYIPWLFSFVSKIIYLTPRDIHGILTGQYYVLFLLVVTKFTDVGAFVCGSLFGRHGFFPHVSSTKTKEGCIGALLFALLSGSLFFIFFQHKVPLLHFTSVFIISLILGIAAMAGDLAESLLKRTLQTKDSSNTLPGIGGGLDLIDSILFTAPIFYFILQVMIWEK